MEASYQLEETARSSSTRLMPDPLLRLLEEEDGNHTGPWPRFEALFRPPTAPRRRPITAQGMDAAAKGVLHASAAFFGPVLLQLALAQANANCDDDPADDCRVFWHWEPRSVLTTSSVVATWTVAVVLPFWGAAIDRHKTSSSTGSSTPTSSHSSPADGRYRAGRATAYLLVALHLLQTFISSSTWFFFWIAHTLAEALNMIHQMYVAWQDDGAWLVMRSLPHTHTPSLPLFTTYPQDHSGLSPGSHHRRGNTHILYVTLCPDPIRRHVSIFYHGGSLCRDTSVAGRRG